MHHGFIYLTGGDDFYWWSLSGIKLFTKSTEADDPSTPAQKLPALYVCAANVEGMPPLAKDGWSASTNMLLDDGMRKFGMTQEKWDALPKNAIDTSETTERDPKVTRWTSYKAQAKDMDFTVKFGDQPREFNRIQLKTSYDPRPNRNNFRTGNDYVRSMDHPRHFKVSLTDINGSEIDFLELTDDMADDVTDICFDGVESAHQITITLLAEPESMANPSHNHYWWTIRDVNLYQVTVDDLPASIPEEVVCPAGYYVEKANTKSESSASDVFSELAIDCVSMSNANDTKPASSSQELGAYAFTIPDYYSANDAALSGTTGDLASCEDPSKRVTGLRLHYQKAEQGYGAVEAICEQHIEPLDCPFGRVGSMLVLEPVADRRFVGASVTCISTPTEGAPLETTATMQSEQYGNSFAVVTSTYEPNEASLTNKEGNSIVSCSAGETVTGVALRYDERLGLYVAEDPECSVFSSISPKESIPSVPRKRPNNGAKLRQCDAYTHMYLQYSGKSTYLEGRHLFKSIGNDGHPNEARDRARDAIRDCMEGWVKEGKKPTEMGACNNEGVWNKNGKWEVGTTKIDREDVLERDLESFYGDTTFVEYLRRGPLQDLCSPEAADAEYEGPNKDSFRVKTVTFVSNRGKSFFIPTTAQSLPTINDGQCARNYANITSLTVAQLCGSRNHRQLDIDGDGILDDDEFPGCENDKNANCAELRGVVTEVLNRIKYDDKGTLKGDEGEVTTHYNAIRHEPDLKTACMALVDQELLIKGKEKEAKDYYPLCAGINHNSRTPPRVPPPTCSPIFEAWDQHDFKGKHYRWGTNCPEAEDGWDDKIRSLKIHHDFVLKVCDKRELEGACAYYHTKHQDTSGMLEIPNLSDSKYQPTGFNFDQRISSWRYQEKRWPYAPPPLNDFSHLETPKARQRFFHEEVLRLRDDPSRYKNTDSKNQFFGSDGKEGRVLDTAELDRVFKEFDDKETADFRISIMVRALFNSGDTVGPNDRLIEPRLKQLYDDGRFWLKKSEWGKGEGHFVYWSENHMLMWNASVYLLDQRYRWSDDPTLDFEERKQEAIMVKRRLNVWLDLKLNYGFFEFFSTNYYIYTLGALMNLADFAADDEIRDKATRAAERMMTELLLVFNDRGAFYPAAGRNLGKHYTSFNPQILFWILTGKGKFKSDGPGYFGGFIATTKMNLSNVAKSYQSIVDTRLNQGYDIRDKSVYGGLPREERAIFQWSAGGYFHPATADDTVYAVNCYGLHHRDEFDLTKYINVEVPYKKVTEFIPYAKEINKLWPFGDNCNTEAVTVPPSIVAHVASFKSVSSNLTRASINIFKNKSVGLSSLEDYYAGYQGYQQWPWAATVGDIAVWTQSGDLEDNFEMKSVNQNSHLPKVRQVDNVALITYYPHFIIGNWSFSKRVTLYWPEDRFDEHEVINYDANDNLSWLVARKGESYIAVVRFKSDGNPTYHGHPSSKVNQGRQMWAVVVGNKDMYGSYYDFKNKVRAAELSESFTFDIPRLPSYDPSNYKKVYRTKIIFDGKKIEQVRRFALLGN